jgi:hypothetical protein
LAAPLAFSAPPEALLAACLLAAGLEPDFAFDLEAEVAFDREAAFGFFALDLERAFDPFPWERLCEPLPLDPVLLPLLVFVVAIVSSLPMDRNSYPVGTRAICGQTKMGGQGWIWTTT